MKYIALDEFSLGIRKYFVATGILYTHDFVYTGFDCNQALLCAVSFYHYLKISDSLDGANFDICKVVVFANDQAIFA